MSRPNLLLVVLGGVRADHLASYGYHRETMPFVDEVAQQGVRFPNMIATSPSTLPAHASLLTGLFASTHGATSEAPFLRPLHRTLAQYLQARGYRTAAFSASDWICPETGFGAGFEVFFTQRYQSRFASRAVRYGRQAGDRLLRRKDAGARRSNQAFQEWLAGGEGPFFAFVHYQEAVLPVDPPSPFDSLFLEAGGAVGRAVAASQDAGRYVAGQPAPDDEECERLRALYDGALRYVDSRLSEIATLLQQKGAWDSTLVVIVGDHGECLGEHGLLGHKLSLFDSLLRVPLVLRCPRNVPQGFSLEELAQTVDVLPTVLDLLEVGWEEPMQGRVLLREGRATPGPGFAIAERFRPDLDALRKRYPASDLRPHDVRQKAIRTSREKFVWHSDEANELYDLVADPGETRNLIDTDVARGDSLRRRLFEWFAGISRFQTQGAEARQSAGPPP